MVRPKSQSDLSAYDRHYRLREEAHESWQHIITDELVYVADVGWPQDDSGRLIPEIYLKGDLWVEVQFSFVGQRHTYYSAIIESFKSYPREVSTGKMKQDFGAIGGDSPVLVEITHSVQPPQKMRFKGCRSACWLKVSNNSYRIAQNVSELNFEPSHAVAVPSLNDWELNTFVGNNDFQFSQSPNKLIETSSHAIESITTPKRNMIGNVKQLNAEDIPLIFKVFLSGKSAGVRVMEFFESHIQSIKVALRPIQLQIGVCQAGTDHV